MMALSRRARRAAGFSLVEVVVSMAILAVLMIGIFSVLLSSQEVTLSTSSVMNLDESAHQAVRLLRRDLRQSGWEAGSGASMGTGVYEGNQVFLPKPTDTVGDTVQGTAATSVRSAGTHTDLCLFRQRTGFVVLGGDPTAEERNWTNDGTGPPPAPVYIGWRVVNDGNFRNVPTATPRYKLQRFIAKATDEDDPAGTLTGVTNQGAAIQNLSAASFRRLDWDAIEVTLTFLQPGMVWTSSSPPEPSIRKIIEIIKVNNGTAN